MRCFTGTIDVGLGVRRSSNFGGNPRRWFLEREITVGKLAGHFRAAFRPSTAGSVRFQWHQRHQRHLLQNFIKTLIISIDGCVSFQRQLGRGNGFKLHGADGRIIMTPIIVCLMNATESIKGKCYWVDNWSTRIAGLILFLVILFLPCSVRDDCCLLCLCLSFVLSFLASGFQVSSSALVN